MISLKNFLYFGLFIDKLLPLIFFENFRIKDVEYSGSHFCLKFPNKKFQNIIIQTLSSKSLFFLFKKKYSTTAKAYKVAQHTILKYLFREARL